MQDTDWWIVFCLATSEYCVLLLVRFVSVMFWMFPRLFSMKGRTICND